MNSPDEYLSTHVSLFFVFCSLALFMAIFVIWVHYGSYWVNLKTMFYRLSNLGASPFRPTLDTKHLFLSILICVSRTRDGDIHVDHGCWRRNIGDNLKILMTNFMRSLKYRWRWQWCWPIWDVGDRIVLLVTFCYLVFLIYQIGHQNLQIVTNIASPTSVKAKHGWTDFQLSYSSS